MVTGPAEVLLVLLVGAGATGVAYYAYSSYRIGATFGIASVPYGAVYAALLVSAFVPAASVVDRPVAILMSVVAWALFTLALARTKVVVGFRWLKVIASGVGFFALIVFPLFSPPALEFVLTLLYRGVAVGGWVAGARPGLGRRGAKR